jgi:hypothetical protein
MTDIQIIMHNNTPNDNMESLTNKCNKIAESFYKLKNRFEYSNIMLQENYKKDKYGNIIMNNRFDEIELIEENLDELFYVYSLIKGQIADARKLNLDIEKQTKILN